MLRSCGGGRSEQAGFHREGMPAEVVELEVVPCISGIIGRHGNYGGGYSLTSPLSALSLFCPLSCRSCPHYGLASDKHGPPIRSSFPERAILV